MAEPLPGIEHVVLLMFENRSFDNMLGAFYPGSAARGGVPTGFANPFNGSDVPAWQAGAGSAAQTMPYPDPQESFDHMQDQIDGQYGPMMGFVADYATVEAAEPEAIMQYYIAENVPVTHALGMAYAASDRYFASGPVQTWPNRLFSICGTPGYDPGANTAYVNNDEYPSYPLIDGQLDYLSIFEQLDGAGRSWRVYHDDDVPIAALVSYVWEHWDWFESGGDVWPFEPTFFDDVMNDQLPSFSLIEPRYQMHAFLSDKAPNSNHPGSSSAWSSTGVPISVSCGEKMLASVFQALVNNPALFAKTLLIVTYDEHGGLFDHVYPPEAVSPFAAPVSNFNYTSYGVRVPALFVNPYVNSGLFPPESSSASISLDHTSILATLRDQFSLSGSLSPRVDQAQTMAGLVDPSQQPITPPSITVPECVWSPPSAHEHAEPIVRSLLWRGSMAGRKPKRGVRGNTS